MFLFLFFFLFKFYFSFYLDYEEGNDDELENEFPLKLDINNPNHKSRRNHKSLINNFSPFEKERKRLDYFKSREFLNNTKQVIYSGSFNDLIEKPPNSINFFDEGEDYLQTLNNENEEKLELLNLNDQFSNNTINNYNNINLNKKNSNDKFTSLLDFKRKKHLKNNNTKNEKLNTIYTVDSGNIYNLKQNSLEFDDASIALGMEKQLELEDESITKEKRNNPLIIPNLKLNLSLLKKENKEEKEEKEKLKVYFLKNDVKNHSSKYKTHEVDGDVVPNYTNLSLHPKSTKAEKDEKNKNSKFTNKKPNKGNKSCTNVCGADCLIF